MMRTGPRRAVGAAALIHPGGAESDLVSYKSNAYKSDPSRRDELQIALMVSHKMEVQAYAPRQEMADGRR